MSDLHDDSAPSDGLNDCDRARDGEGFDLSHLDSIAQSIARETGELLGDAFLSTTRTFQIESKSSATDLVSDLDVAAEELIRTRLSEARPEDGIMGEEGEDKAGSSGLRWVVDPLDGTINFLYGIPQWCVSIAVEDAHGKALAGAVFDPMRDELWTATAEGAALLNGSELKPSTCADLSQALLATGFSYRAEARAAQAKTVANLLPEVRDIRRLGSAALDLAWTAGGRYDIYFETDLNHWDIAAGLLICTQAGLQHNEFIPALPATPGLVVANSNLLPQVLSCSAP